MWEVESVTEDCEKCQVQTFLGLAPPHSCQRPLVRALMTLAGKRLLDFHTPLDIPRTLF